MLRLVLSQTDTKPNLPNNSREATQPISSEPFSAPVSAKGPLLFIMSPKDPSHYLYCDIILEIEMSKHNLDKCVICHFPQVVDEELYNFVEEDDTLVGIIMIQFQMKIMNELLQFCINHGASNLIIYPDNTYGEYLGIYREFLFCGESLSEVQSDTEIALPIHQHLIDDWMDYMNLINKKFRQMLWQEQRKNPAIKNYLKHHPF